MIDYEREFEVPQYDAQRIREIADRERMFGRER